MANDEDIAVGQRRRTLRELADESLGATADVEKALATRRTGANVVVRHVIRFEPKDMGRFIVEPPLKNPKVRLTQVGRELDVETVPGRDLPRRVRRASEITGDTMDERK